MVAEKSFSWGSTTQQSHLSYQHAATLVVAVIGKVRTQSGMHSPSRLEASLRNSRGKSPRISFNMEQNLYRLQRSVSCMSLSTQLLALVYLLSMCYAPAAYPKCRRQNNCYLSYNTRCARSGCHSWLSFITVVIQAHPSLLPEHQVVRSYLYSACARPAAIALNYSVKNIWNGIPRPIYTERRTTENNITAKYTSSIIVPG